MCIESLISFIMMQLQRRTSRHGRSTTARYPTELSLTSGAFERYNIARNYVRFYNNVGITATYEFPPNHFETTNLRAVIFSALRQVIDRHPVLSISIADEGTETPSFFRLCEIDLTEIVTFADSDDSIEIAHRQPFEHLDVLPLWRVVVIQKDALLDIGFFWHHVIGDGESGIAFHMSLCDALRTPDDSSPIVIPRSQKLLPPAEEAMSLSLSFWYKLKILYKVLFPQKPDSVLWSGPDVRAENNMTHLRTLFLPAMRVDSLVTHCRKHGVTITALFLVVIARVLARVYPDYPHFTSKTAISMRRFTDVGKDEMVGYVTSLRHYFSTREEKGHIYIDGKFSWEAVSQARELILSATKSPSNQGIALLKYLKNPIEWFRKQVGTKRPDSFEISNLGVVDGKFKRLLFSQSSNVIGPAYVFSMVTLQGGELAIGLTWQEDIVTANSAEKLLSDLTTELETI